MNTMQQSQNPGLILVLGNTGNTGSRVAARLNQKGVPFRGGSRSSSPVFDWNRPAGWGAVLEGIQSVYVAYPQELPIEHATEHIGAFIQHAREAGVKHIVLLTGRGEENGLVQENLLKESGLGWTVIRSAWFSQNFSEGSFADWVDSGELVLPGGRASEPFVDIEDIADVACAALSLPGHMGQVYEVTGPRLLSFGEIAAELTHMLNKPVEFTPVTHAEYRARLKEFGVPESNLALVDFLFQELLDGRNTHLGDGVRKALGREPTDFKAFVQRDLTDRSTRPSGQSVPSYLGAASRAEQIHSFKRFVAEFINGGDEGVLDELVHEDYVYRGPDQEVRGKNGLIHMFRNYRNAFPDLAVTTHNLMADGDKIIMDFSLQGAHKGEFMGMPATGKNFRIRGLIVSRFKEGKITEDWEILDLMTLLNQLEAIPGAALSG